MLLTQVHSLLSRIIIRITSNVDHIGPLVHPHVIDVHVVGLNTSKKANNDVSFERLVNNQDGRGDSRNRGCQGRQTGNCSTFLQKRSVNDTQRFKLRIQLFSLLPDSPKLRMIVIGSSGIGL